MELFLFLLVKKIRCHWWEIQEMLMWCVCRIQHHLLRNLPMLQIIKTVLFVALLYHHITEKIYSSMFAICGITIVCVYIRIYCFLLGHRTRIRKNTERAEGSNCCSDKVSQSNGKTSKRLTRCQLLEMSSLYRSSYRSKQKHRHTRYFKSAVVFSGVAFVFICAFLPAWMMKLKVIEFNVYVFYLYFVYTVCNPFIYGFINPTFMTAIRKTAGLVSNTWC